MQKSIAVVGGISGYGLADKLHTRGYKAALICGREGEPGCDIADLLLVKDLSEHESILEFLYKADINEVVFGTGHIKAFYLAEYLQKSGIKVSIDPAKSLLAKDKYRYKLELIKHNFLTPDFIFFDHSSTDINVNTILDYISLPCVVKSNTDLIYPKKANSRFELEKAIQELQNLKSEILIEEFIDGIEVTVPVKAAGKQAEAIMLSYYNKAKECQLYGFKDFTNQHLNTKQEREAMLLASDVIQKTGIVGVARLDIMYKNESYYILECNSVMVTGVHENQLEYGMGFLAKENIDFAELTIDNALTVFKRT